MLLTCQDVPPVGLSHPERRDRGLDRQFEFFPTCEKGLIPVVDRGIPLYCTKRS